MYDVNGDESKNSQYHKKGILLGITLPFSPRDGE